MTSSVLDGMSTLPTIGSYPAGTDAAGTSNIFGGDGVNLSRRTRRAESREYRQQLLGLSTKAAEVAVKGRG